jgi:hypothetical protein
MSPDILTIMMVGASALLAMDVACFIWLRSNAGRAERQPARVEHLAKGSRTRTLRPSGR